MAVCRMLGEDGKPQYALFDPQQQKVCPIANITSDAPSEEELFDRSSKWLDDLPRPEQWDDLPDRLLPPIPPNGKVICIGLNYRDHAIETGAEIPTEPVVFSKFGTSVVGHGDSIQLPRVAHQVDYEAELVVIIGKTGKNISPTDAMDHVFGYTCGHDVSARDWQKGRPGGQWLLGKTFDTFAPLGPCLVTKQELLDPGNVRVQMLLNDEVVQDSTTAQLIFDIPTLIAHLSQIVTLYPGDAIFTGTPPGVGAARNPPVFLKPGDRCTVMIDGIGSLTNECVAEDMS